MLTKKKKKKSRRKRDRVAISKGKRTSIMHRSNDFLVKMHVKITGTIAIVVFMTEKKRKKERDRESNSSKYARATAERVHQSSVVAMVVVVVGRGCADW